MIIMIKVNKSELLSAFARLCKVFQVESAGFDPQAIGAPIDPKWDGVERWAMSYRKGCGWMIVSGYKGCGATFARWNGYIKGRWNFLIYIEGLTESASKARRKAIGDLV
jgi:hypothetical protein